MVKRTLHFGNPAHLSTSKQQLVVELKDEQRTTKTIPIEDIGIVVLEHPHITFTANLLELLLENQVALISCNSKYMPTGLFMPLEGNSEQTERMRTQIGASEPLKKQLWQQTIKAKIHNQARVAILPIVKRKQLLIIGVRFTVQNSNVNEKATVQMHNSIMVMLFYVLLSREH
jgi:CRISPR-associated protein Cas1